MLLEAKKIMATIKILLDKITYLNDRTNYKLKYSSTL